MMEIPEVPGDLHLFNNNQYRPTLSLDFVRGVFNALEFTNTERNRYQGFNFDLREFPLVNNDVVISISWLFSEEIGQVVSSSEILFRKDLEKWLFYDLTDSDSDYSLFVEQLMVIISKMIKPLNYYRIPYGSNIQPYFTGIDYDNHIIVSVDMVCFFHFSFST